APDMRSGRVLLPDLPEVEDLYALLEDAQDGRTRISQRVAMDLQRVNLLMGDRMTLQETVWIVEEEAYASRKTWAHLIGLSTSDTTAAAEYSHLDTTPGMDKKSKQARTRESEEYKAEAKRSQASAQALAKILL
ncbi:hypothetical protein Tco_0869569, partial [Tanacetum coccineum]